MIRILKILLITLLSVIVLFGLIVIRLFAIKIYDSIVQQQHMKKLEAMYSDNYQAIDESEFINFDRFDETIKLNEIQILASHNSYKKEGSGLGKLFVGLGDSFAEAKALRYGYKNITDQLELGIRSMEFDLRKRKDSFVLTHVPLVDNSSVAPNFSMALDEIKLYSSHNETHIPIIILLEIKDDWMILDHALQKIESDELIMLNQLLEEKLGDTLYRPSDLMQEGLSIRETIETYGWPSVSSLLGKVLFVIHPDNFNESYLSLDPTLEDLPMFIGSYEDDLEYDYASFVVHNDVDVDRITELVDQGYIVRTRIDEQLIFDQKRYHDAILSGAQLLTSDFTKGRKDLKVSQTITLDPYMIIKRES